MAARRGILNWVQKKVPDSDFSAKTLRTTLASASSQKESPAASPMVTSGVEIFVDGSCLGNGKRGKGAHAGIGVVVPVQPELDLSEELPGSEATNNRAELYAIIRAIELTNQTIDRGRGQVLTIKSDSELAVKTCNIWLPQWKSRNWTKYDGAPPANLDLLFTLDKLLATRTVRLLHVRAHTNGRDHDSLMNDRADRLAKSAAQRQL